MARLNYKDVLRGDRGYTFKPHISDDGYLFWTNDGDLPNPPPIKVKGEDGKVENMNFFIDERGHLILKEKGEE